MRPIPIPDHLVPDWGERKVIAPPGNDFLHETISAVEAIVGPVVDDDGNPTGQGYTMLIQIEETDWDPIIEAGGVFLLTMEGHVVPFGLKPLEITTEQ